MRDLRFDVEREEGELSFRFQRNNPAHQECTGITSEDALGKTPQEVFGEQQGQVIASQFRKCAEKRDPVEFEKTIEKAGRAIERQTEILPVIEGDEVTKLVGIVRETVEQEEDERELNQADEQLRVLFEQAPDGIVVHDGEGQVIRVNETLSEMLGYTRNELESMRIFDFEIGIDEETLRERWKSMEAGGMQKVEDRAESAVEPTDGAVFVVELPISE